MYTNIPVIIFSIQEELQKKVCLFILKTLIFCKMWNIRTNHNTKERWNMTTECWNKKHFSLDKQFVPHLHSLHQLHHGTYTVFRINRFDKKIRYFVILYQPIKIYGWFPIEEIRSKWWCWWLRGLSVLAHLISFEILCFLTKFNFFI